MVARNHSAGVVQGVSTVCSLRGYGSHYSHLSRRSSYFDTYGESTHTPSRAFFSWVEMVLKKNPEDRPSLPRLLSHRFLSRFTDEECHQILVSYFASIPELSDESSKETFKSHPSRSTPKWKYCSVCNKHTKL